MAPNLLKNPSFEGDTYFVDQFGAVAIPREWKIVFRGGGDPRMPGQDAPWGQPNAGRLHVNNVPEHEQSLFFLNGEHCWKIWTESSYPFYFTLSQAVRLTPGARYRFTVNALPDMVAAYGPKGKVFLDNPNAAGVRLVVKSGGQTFATDDLRGDKVPFGRYTAVRLEFTAPSAEAEVAVEAYGIYGIKNNCFFFDDLSLTQIEDAPAATGGGQPRPDLAPPPAQQLTAPAVNLLSNGSFEDGQAYYTDDRKDIAVPAGWVFNYHDSATEKLPEPYGRPATVLLSRRKTPEADRARLFAHGNYAWKITGANHPIWVSLSQGVAGLTPGRQYRASVYLLADFPASTDSGEVNLTIHVGGGEHTSGWLPCGEMPAGQYNRVEVSFTAAADRVDFTLEVRSRAALPQGAWYVDLLALEPA